MTGTIPIGGFAPPERVPIGVIQRQAAGLSQAPLPAQLLNSLLDYDFILNEQRQIVFASQNAGAFLGGRDPASLLGMRPGEALDCEHAAAAPAGCGTGDHCAECAIAQAIVAGLGGERTQRDCRVTRLLTCAPPVLDLRLSVAPFEHLGERYLLLSVTDVHRQERCD